MTPFLCGAAAFLAVLLGCLIFLAHNTIRLFQIQQEINRGHRKSIEAVAGSIGALHVAVQSLQRAVYGDDLVDRALGKTKKEGDTIQ